MEPDRAAANSVPPPSEILVRLLRHELGDLLQTIYASVAILQERLPQTLTLERRVLGDLRARGDVCKNVMDAVHDYVCPVALNIDTVDLGDLTKQLVAAAAPQFPRLQVQADVDPRTPRIEADARRLAQVGNLLLSNACQAAQKRVTFTVRPGPSGAGPR